MPVGRQEVLKNLLEHKVKPNYWKFPKKGKYDRNCDFFILEMLYVQKVGVQQLVIPRTRNGWKRFKNDTEILFKIY